MIRVFVTFVIVFFFVKAQSQLLVGTDGYVEYSIGKLPVLISVPHGGNVAPAFIPDRKCNNPTTVTDANTIDLGIKIDSIFKVKTGCGPHMVYCRLRRTKLDANRNLSDGTCGNPIAVNAWQEFHHFIDTARLIIQSKYGNKAFYFDLHGHGNPIQRIELGYLLRDNELELNDDVLNDPIYVTKSSIQNLVKHNLQKLTHSQLLRGQKSLGTLLENRFYPAVPSTNNPSPGISSGYFSGGYNTANHTCFNPMLDINGVQVECNFSNVRDTEKNRIAFAGTFVDAVIEYMKIHFDIDLTKCNEISNLDHEVQDNIIVYPTVIRANEVINIYNAPENAKIYWFDSSGKLLETKNIIENQCRHPKNIASGIYFLKIQANKQIVIKKIIVADL